MIERKYADLTSVMLIYVKCRFDVHLNDDYYRF